MNEAKVKLLAKFFMRSWNDDNEDFLALQILAEVWDRVYNNVKKKGFYTAQVTANEAVISAVLEMELFKNYGEKK